MILISKEKSIKYLKPGKTKTKVKKEDQRGTQVQREKWTPQQSPSGQRDNAESITTNLMLSVNFRLAIWLSLIITWPESIVSRTGQKK